MITVIKPKGCKNCEHWDEEEYPDRRARICHGANGCNDPDELSNGFVSENDEWAWADLITGPDFYCCHFKEKKGI